MWFRRLILSPVNGDSAVITLSNLGSRASSYVLATGLIIVFVWRICEKVPYPFTTCKGLRFIPFYSLQVFFLGSYHTPSPGISVILGELREFKHKHLNLKFWTTAWPLQYISRSSLHSHLLLAMKAHGISKDTLLPFGYF